MPKADNLTTFVFWMPRNPWSVNLLENWELFIYSFFPSRIWNVTLAAQSGVIESHHQPTDCATVLMSLWINFWPHKVLSSYLRFATCLKYSLFIFMFCLWWEGMRIRASVFLCICFCNSPLAANLAQHMWGKGITQFYSELCKWYFDPMRRQGKLNGRFFISL